MTLPLYYDFSPRHTRMADDYLTRINKALICVSIAHQLAKQTFVVVTRPRSRKDRSKMAKKVTSLCRGFSIFLFAVVVLITGDLFAAPISSTYFNLWGTHNDFPYYREDGVVIPVGRRGTVDNYVGAQGQYSITSQGFSFTGVFWGKDNTPTSASEMAVFLSTDVITWEGQEFGFVKTLGDNVLKAYVQTPTAYNYEVISTGNTGYNNYKAIVDSENTSLVHFYVDDEYVLSIWADSTSYNFYNQDYFMVGGTIRLDNPFWPSRNQQIEIYNVHIW